MIPEGMASGVRRGPIAWMAGNPVAANLLMVVLLVGGLFSATRIKQELFPDFDLDLITIAVPYPGASPAEVEQGIVLAVEEAIQGLDGVEQITATASEGSGSVTVEVLAGTDMQRLAQDIQSAVDRIGSFPEDAEDPRVAVVSRRREVVSLVIHGDLPDRVLRTVAEEVRDRLLQAPGITQADLSGVRALEIGIEVPRENLRTYGLTLEEVARRIRQAAVELPGGAIKAAGGEILVRMNERRDWGREFAQIPILTSADGTPLRLEDLAVIRDDLADSDRRATHNGEPAAMVDVFRVGDQTPITVVDSVRRLLPGIRQDLPPGVSIDTLRDRSEYYRQRLDLLLGNGLIGLLLVLVLLGLFLERRLAFWVTMGIPISFLGSLLLLPSLGVSINMVSMFAFIIALGIVVDDTIIVGENIYSHRQRGVPFFQAAVRGTREVVRPVTFSVLTNIVTFMPLYFVPGIMGKIFRAIPLVVATAFAISLIECIFVLPAHLAHQRRNRRPGLLERMQQRFSRGFGVFIERAYGPFLALALRHRYTVAALGLAVLAATLGYMRSGRLGMGLFPRVESDYAFAGAVLPYGTAVANTERVQRRLLEAARRVAARHGGDRLLEGLSAEIGGSYGGSAGGHVTTVRAYLTGPDQRPLSTGEFTRQWRREVGDLPGLETLSFRSDRGGPGSGADITVELSHTELGVLEDASAELAAALQRFAQVTEVDDGFTPGKRQVDFRILAEGRALGLTAREVARQIRHAFYGAEVLRQQRGRNELRVMVRLPESERESEYDLEEFLVRTPGGQEVPLREVAEARRGRAYTVIHRRNGRRVVTVTADVEPSSQSEQVLRALTRDTLPRLVSRYRGLAAGFEGKQADRIESMRALVRGLLAALLIVYAILAIPFRSYIQPAIIMASVPFGIVGAVLGHILMGYSLSVVSMFGVVALAGVVVNDSLVLIDFANRRRRTGLSAVAAVHIAGRIRFRPILLTTLTTFGGLAPMIFETSRQARFLIPMAISLGFGILFATVISLVLVPSLYVVVDDLTRLKDVVWGGGAPVRADDRF